MKLISESHEEDHLIAGLTALLCDLGVDADGYRKDEAIAVTFLTSQDLKEETACLWITPHQQISLLQSTEDCIRAAMRKAGYETLQKAILHAGEGKAHLNHTLNRL